MRSITMRSVRVQLSISLLGILLQVLLLDLVPLSGAFSTSTSSLSSTFLGQRREYEHWQQRPIGIGIASLTLTPAKRGPLRRTACEFASALYASRPTGPSNKNNHNQTGNAVNEDGSNDNESASQSFSFFELDLDIDASLLVPDLLGVAVACELLGLLDAVNEPTFLQQGGWLQSVGGGVPTTLPLLVSRFSTNSVFWIMACSCLGISKPKSNNSSNSKDTTKLNAMASGPSAVGYALKIGTVFCVLRILLAVALAAWLGFDRDDRGFAGSSSRVLHCCAGNGCHAVFRASPLL
jgi:hypothetical protein